MTGTACRVIAFAGVLAGARWLRGRRQRRRRRQRRSGSAADVARKLGRTPHFLVGMGNDLANDHAMDGAYTLGVTLDLHYAYMVGLPGQGGWPDWNAGGTFVNILADAADAKGVTPMYTLYAMASIGDGNLSGLAMDSFMEPYWDGVRLLFERIAAFGKPALVHVEPDFWAYAQQMSDGNPAGLPGARHEPGARVRGPDRRPGRPRPLHPAARAACSRPRR